MDKEFNQENSFSLRGFSIVSSLLSVLNHTGTDDVNYVLAKYLLERIDTLDTISIYDVAEDCFASRSSIHRFVKRIGFESFTHMKENIKPVRMHSNAYVEYVEHVDFEAYFKYSTGEMIREINEIALEKEIPALAQQIHESKRVVILCADVSSSAAKMFQQEMIWSGRLIQVITSASQDVSVLDALAAEDLLIVCSVTGNFAIAIEAEIAGVQAHKKLITLNHAKRLEKFYDSIVYLSNQFQPSEQISSGMQNVYTRYGVSYFFDLLFRHYRLTYYR